MTKLLMPYGSARYLAIMVKEATVKGHMVTKVGISKSFGSFAGRVVRRNAR